MLLTVQGHPDSESFVAAVATAYADAARSAADVRVIDLATAEFDPVLRYGYRRRMATDPFVAQSISALQEARHVAVVFPIWWAGEPSLLKGWFDRVLVPGVAYHYRPGKTTPDRLLAGRTATLIATSHAPAWYARRNPRYALTRLRRDVLGYCGIKVTSTLVLGGMEGAADTAENRADFLVRARALGTVDAVRRAGRSASKVNTG